MVVVGVVDRSFSRLARLERVRDVNDLFSRIPVRDGTEVGFGEVGYWRWRVCTDRVQTPGSRLHVNKSRL